MYRFFGSAYVRKCPPGRLLGPATVLFALLATTVLPAPGPAAARPAPSARPALSGQPAPSSRPAPSARPAEAKPYSGRPVHFKGWAFDTCEAPSLATMRAWRRASPYRAVGVYFGGRARGCPRQKNLNRQWIKSVDRMGWFLLPVYVGSQAPCVEVKHKRGYAIGSAPWRQGTAEGQDAVRRAKWHGMIPGSTLYLDMEAYDIGNRGCAERTLSFVRAWNREVRKHRYFPGYYSSADSGISHLERARKAGVGDLPTVLWFARWGKKPSVAGEPSLHPRAWAPHRRVHQYAGNVKETRGGHRLNIDRNRVDALVARTWE
ncbi:DUF1906 domain-containing protein [Streptomyces sp. NPDC021093]|uniref:DUF1906 domain-containing protein n=1 Tax=Streptomyces sp. NPDC021093 TaxID=3365112 RepID=UPI003787C005